MRILQVCFRPQIPANDGGAIAMYNLTKGWTNNPEIELSLFVVTTQKHHTDKASLEKEFGIKNIVCSSINTKVSFWGAFSNLFKKESYNISRFNKSSLKKDLALLLKETAYDMIHFEGLFVSPLLQTAREFNPHAVCALRAHNVEHVIWQRQSRQATGLKKWYLSKLAEKLADYENHVVPLFNVVIPISNIDEPYFNALGCNTFVNSTGIIMDKDETLKEIAPQKVFHLGSLDWAPNIEGLEWFSSKVWPKVLAQIPEAEFYIAGKNKPENVEKISGKNTYIIGEVPSAKDFMQAHGVMIVPLLSGSGMRIKVVEGMSYGCPILSTPVGAEGIDLTHEEDIILASDEDTFADELISLLRDPLKAQKIGERARQNAIKNYANENKVKALTHFYSSILK